MIVIYTLRSFSRSDRAKLQKRNRLGQFAKRLPTAKQVEKNPIVKVWYPSSQDGLLHPRDVRLISATPQYVVGLEITKNQDKTHYQYKKFSQSRIQHFLMKEFNPKSMS